MWADAVKIAEQELGVPREGRCKNAELEFGASREGCRKKCRPGARRPQVKILPFDFFSAGMNGL
jgi:hypothetical protein